MIEVEKKIRLTGKMPSFVSSAIGMAAVILVVSFVTLGPLLTILWRSFNVRMPQSDSIIYGFQNWVRVFSEPNLLNAVGNSLFIAVTVFFLSTALAIFFAWVVTRTDLPMKGAIELALWTGFFLPLTSQALGWILLFDPGYGLINQALHKIPFVTGSLNIYSYGGIIWTHLAFATSARFILISPAFKRMDPALEEAARISGSSYAKTLFSITIPILAPSILASAFLGLIKALESFEVELLLGTPAGIYVYSTKIYQVMMEKRIVVDFEGAAALGSLFLFIIFALFFVYRIVLGKREFVTVSGRGFTPRVTPLGKWRWVAATLCWLFVLIMMITPVAIIILGTFMKLFGFFNIPAPFTTNHWTTAFQDNVLLLSFSNSIFLALGAGVIGMFTYALISYLVVKTNLRGRGILDFVSWLPWALPGILLGLGLLWLFLGNPILSVLYGSLSGLILAMIIKEMPVGIQMAKAGLMQIGKELEEAAYVSGASWLVAFRKIITPLLLPCMLNVTLIVSIVSIRDVGLVILLASHNSRTLSLLMIDYIWGADYGRASVIGVILVLIIVVLAISSKMIQKRFEIQS